MAKIICEICGTSYPDTAEQCPICGCTREAAAQMLGEDLILEDTPAEAPAKGKTGRTSARSKKEIFDFDEVNSGAKKPQEEETSFEEGEEDEPEDDGKGPNTFVVILLTVLIAALLLAAGFLFVRYILPGLGGEDATEPVTTAEVQSTTETVSIPCENLVLSSGNTAVLTEAGGKFLLHVNPIPTDTTDELIFTSSDENVATVTADGRIEAVGEGEAIVTISCGNQKIECTVTVKFDEETVATTGVTVTEAATGETTGETTADATGETTGETTDETTATSSGATKDVTLKLKRSDISLGVGYSFQLLLDCDLEQSEVEWSSEQSYIASVDEEGNVKALQYGTTSITAKYGDQEVSCMVRCK